MKKIRFLSALLALVLLLGAFASCSDTDGKGDSTTAGTPGTNDAPTEAADPATSRAAPRTSFITTTTASATSRTKRTRA